MSEMDPTVEGRLLALRQALAMVIAGKGPDQILERLDDNSDGQEDPGAVPSDGLAVDGALVEERRMLAREIRLRQGG
jgi:hypothetical protein